MFGLALATLISMFAMAGWISHVIWTFSQESVASVLLGILGCLMFPIGALHGIITWF